MPYKVGKKGSYGCSGYPAIKTSTKEVMGCHKTAKEAAGQIYAINRSEGKIGKAMTSFQEGDFVIVSCEDEIHVGRVEYVMTTGASGLPGSEYYLETSPDKPALVVRTLEFESDGQYWEETMYLVSVAAEEATKIAPLPLDAEALMVDGQLVPEPDTMPEMKMADKTMDCCPEENIEKKSPCWEGYVQRGMKEQNGKMVPNCVPVTKSDEVNQQEETKQESFFNFRDLRPIRGTVRVGK